MLGSMKSRRRVLLDGKELVQIRLSYFRQSADFEIYATLRTLGGFAVGRVRRVEFSTARMAGNDDGHCDAGRD
jgi:hypothetical protein